MLEIDLGLFERALFDLHVRFRLVQRAIAWSSSDCEVFCFFTSSCIRVRVDLGEFQSGLRILQIALRLGHRRLENRPARSPR